MGESIPEICNRKMARAMWIFDFFEELEGILISIQGDIFIILLLSKNMVKFFVYNNNSLHWWSFPFRNSSLPLDGIPPERELESFIDPETNFFSNDRLNL